METAFVIARSHRAREKLTNLLGYKPTEYFKFGYGQHWTEIPADRLEDALAIKGISRPRKIPEGIMKCWNLGAENGTS